MAHSSKKTALLLAGVASIALSLGVSPANAAPLATGLVSPEGPTESIGYYGRRGPPVLPYYYAPGRPGGWSFYFGFVPYARGNYEVQALQRRYPQMNWPPSMRAWTPQSGF